MKRRNAMVVVSIATTLALALSAPGGAFARGRWQDVISPAARARGRGAPMPAAVERDLLERPRAPTPPPPRAVRIRPPRASEPAPEARETNVRESSFRESSFSDRPRPSRVMDHAAGDRLREALAAAQDDPKSVAHINRLIALAAAEARRNKALGERVWYWRDPFSANPRRAIVLSLETQLEMQLWQARQEAARARIETAAARNEAALAHVEAARARSQAAHSQGPSGRNGAMVAHQSRATRPADDDATRARSPRRMVPASPFGAAPGHDSRDEPRHVRRRLPSVPISAPSETALARNEAGAGERTRHHDIEAAPPAEAPAPNRTAWRSRDPRGIVVVPIGTSVAALPRKH